MRQLWFVYYNSERNLVVRMKISKNRQLERWQSGHNADVLKTSGRDERPVGSNPTLSVFIHIPLIISYQWDLFSSGLLNIS